jgi:hypothetical protein
MPAEMKGLAAKQLKEAISFGLLSIKADWPVKGVPYCWMGFRWDLW